MTSVAYSMFNGFNRANDTKVMMGNWQEERALREITGYTRAPSKKGQSSGNQWRVIYHTEQELPKDYNSTYRNQFRNTFDEVQKDIVPPRKGRDYGKIYEIVRSARDEVDRNKALEGRKAYYSTNTADALKYDPDAFGAEYTNKKFYKNRALTKPRTDKRPIVFPKTNWSDIKSGEAITLYSLEARRSDKGVNFKMSNACGVNPFGRSTRYTNIEPFKNHSEHCDHKGMKPGGPGLLMHDRNTLEDLRVKLLDIISRIGSKADTVSFLARGTDGSLLRYIKLDDLKAKLGDLGITLSPKEVLAIKRTFDYGGYDDYSPSEFISTLC